MPVRVSAYHPQPDAASQTSRGPLRFARSKLRQVAKIYTKTGDDGTTGLIGGSRVAKSDPRIQVIGDLDELNACLGVALAFLAGSEPAQLLQTVQSHLFRLGAVLAQPGKVEGLDPKSVPFLEQEIDAAQARLQPLTRFILPGGAPAGAFLHLARAVARRAERNLTILAASQPVHPSVNIYLNRLADLLFCLARLTNANEGRDEVKWTPETES